MNMFSHSGDHPRGLPESNVFTANYYIYAGIYFHCAADEVRKSLTIPIFVEEVVSHSCKYIILF